MEELHVQTGCRQPGQLRDSVALLEDEHELLPGVVDAVELLEAERERRGLLAAGEEHLGLDVVRAAELVPLPESQLPALAGCDPFLDHGRVIDRRRVDLDLDRRVGPLGGRVAWLHDEMCHARRVPAARRRQT